MIVSLSKIVNFPTFYGQVRSTKIPIKTAYKLSLLNRELNFHINFYKEKMYGILQEYGEVDSNGQWLETEDKSGIKIQAKRSEECAQKIQELLLFEVEISDIYFEIDEFADIEITPEALEAGMIFIK